MEVRYCYKGDQKIFGQTYIPQGGSGKYPTIIIAHGYGSSYLGVKEFGEYLNTYGIASYVFDFCGGSNFSRSDGSMLEMSVMTEVADLNAVIDEVRQWDFVAPDQLFLMGESQGGLVSALTGASRAEEIRGMVLLYPAFNIPKVALEPYGDIANVPPVADVLGSKVGRIYFEDLAQVDLAAAFANFAQPVLIIHGDRDTLVPLANSQVALKKYRDAHLVVIPGADHGFYGKEVDRAAQEILKFIKNEVES